MFVYSLVSPEALEFTETKQRNRQARLRKQSQQFLNLRLTRSWWARLGDSVDKQARWRQKSRKFNFICVVFY